MLRRTDSSRSSTLRTNESVSSTSHTSTSTLTATSGAKRDREQDSGEAMNQSEPTPKEQRTTDGDSSAATGSNNSESGNQTTSLDGSTELAKRQKDSATDGSSESIKKFEIVPYLGHASHDKIIRHHAFIYDGEHPSSKDRTPVTEVLTWGSCESGQTMQEGQAFLDYPCPVKAEAIQSINTVSLFLSGSHCMLVSENGELYAAGDNQEGEISPESENTCMVVPRLIEALSLYKIVQVSSGASHTAALTADQQVISWGNNEMNQLGHSDDKVFRVQPRIMRGIEGKYAVQVVCGDSHTVVLTASGEVFTCGSNAVGSTGHGEFRGNKGELTKVEGLRGIPISQVSAGGHHTIACSVSGLVYCWGRNRFGQLGLGTKRYPHAVFEPKRVDFPEAIQQASAGTSHSAFVSRSGKVYVCGRGTSGQLGLGWTDDKDSSDDEPEYNQSSKENNNNGCQAENAGNAAGDNSQDNNASPVGGVKQSPRKADFLGGLKGKLAAGKPPSSKESRKTPSSIVATDAVTQREEEGISLSDRLLNWQVLQQLLLNENGFNSNHPFATVDSPHLVRGLAGFSAREVSCGDRHTIVLTMDGNVFAFGMNSNGQLGLGKDANHTWNYLKKAMDPWLDHETDDASENPKGLPKFVPFPVKINQISQYGVFAVTAGGDTSAAVRVIRGSVLSHPPGSLPRGIMHFLDCMTLKRIAHHAASTQNFSPLKKIIWDIFGHCSNLSASFLESWIFAADSGNDGEGPKERSGPVRNAVDALVPYSGEWLPRLIRVNAPDYEKSLKDDEEVPSASTLRIRANSAPGQRGGSRPFDFKAMLEATTPRAGANAPGSVPLDRPPSSYSIPTPGVSRTVSEEQSRSPPPGENSASARARLTEDTNMGKEHDEGMPPLSSAHMSTQEMFAEYSNVKKQTEENEDKSSNSDSSSKGGVIVERLRYSSGVDIRGLESAYVAMLQSYEPSVISTLVEAFRNVLSELEERVKTLTEVDSLRVFLPIMLCPLTQSPTEESAELMARLCAILLALPKRSRDILMGWIRRDIPSDIFASRLVRPIQKHISYYVKHATQGNGAKLLASAPKFTEQVERQMKSGHVSRNSAQESQMQAELTMKDGINVVKGLELAIRVLRLFYTLNENVATAQRRHASLVELSDEELDVLPGSINSVESIAAQTSRLEPGSIGLAEDAGDQAESSQFLSSEISATPANSSLHTQAGGLGKDTAGAKVWGKISYEEFHNYDISNIPDALIRRDYERWRFSGYKRTVENISLCAYPFLLNGDAKRRVLHLEARLAMSSEMRNAFARSLFLGAESPFFVVNIRRSHLMEDSLNQIASVPSPMLKKPLKIVFRGEEGVDAGGVQKEWFQLLVRDLFDINFGMFTYNENTRLFWFNPASSDTLAEYRLIGVILGLAIYNQVLLDVHLPQVTYRKLLDYEVGYVDLQQLNPELFSGFQYLLDYEGDDVEDVFCVNFEATYDYFGTIQSVDLIPDGKNTPVTSSNKHDYVRKYTDWVLNSGIQQQFDHFRKGFLSVLDGQTLNMFRPEELELLICGTPHLDFEELERVTQYDGGYDRESETVKMFWGTMYELPTRLQRKFLTFVTGCDRAPIGGLSKLSFTIQKHGTRETAAERLPAASTCFNILLLPDYGDKEMLKDRLMTAITETEGFGLM
eukprot:gb/GECG01016760.1/.p1 GENE.gb/GECG01016760.1/~~gb/GECG01016760.1/.p1  ORF type:complete len:1660 (+),score=233.46 gb/GECG01016760.1/:1-4980(+)